MYSLFIDTHFNEVVIGLFKDGVLVRHLASDEKRTSELAMPFIIQVLSDEGISQQDIDEIICVNGPGSFTGIRIGVTLAKVLALSLKKSVRVVDYLQMMALFVDEPLKYVAILDRNGAFVGVFDEMNRPLEEYKYVKMSEYVELKKKHRVYENVEILYEVVYSFVKNKELLNPHNVNALYVKNIEV